MAASTGEQTSGMVASTFQPYNAGRVVPDILGIDKIMSALLTRLIRAGAGAMCVGMRAFVHTRAPLTHTRPSRMLDACTYPWDVGKYRSLKSESVANIPTVPCM